MLDSTGEHICSLLNFARLLRVKQPTILCHISDVRATANLNQLLNSGERAGTRSSPVPTSSAPEAPPTGLGRVDGATESSGEVGSLQSLMERSDSLLGQLESTRRGDTAALPPPSGQATSRGRREQNSQEKDSSDDSDEISIVGETPGHGGGSALDSLGNFSLNSLFGGDVGRSDSPGGRSGSGSPHRGHRDRGATAQRSFPPPSAAFGSMASMAHHHMMAPPYMTPGWGFPMWNPAGMSVPMPPSGPSIQSDSREQQRSGRSHSRGNRDAKSELPVSDNGESSPLRAPEVRETDSPSGRDTNTSTSISSSSMPPPPFMSMPPYGMPYSYPYSYPYLGMASSGGDSPYFPSMSPFPSSSSFSNGDQAGINWNNIPTTRPKEDRDKPNE